MPEYDLTMVKYGTTCAPYLAIKTLQRLAKDKQKKIPTASKMTLKEFYVDYIFRTDQNSTDSDKKDVDCRRF